MTIIILLLREALEQTFRALTTVQSSLWKSRTPDEEKNVLARTFPRSALIHRANGLGSAPARASPAWGHLAGPATASFLWTHWTPFPTPVFPPTPSPSCQEQGRVRIFCPSSSPHTDPTPGCDLHTSTSCSHGGRSWPETAGFGATFAVARGSNVAHNRIAKMGIHPGSP